MEAASAIRVGKTAPGREKKKGIGLNVIASCPSQKKREGQAPACVVRGQKKKPGRVGHPPFDIVDRVTESMAFYRGSHDPIHDAVKPIKFVRHLLDQLLPHRVPHLLSQSTAVLLYLRRLSQQCEYHASRRQVHALHPRYSQIQNPRKEFHPSAPDEC